MDGTQPSYGSLVVARGREPRLLEDKSKRLWKQVRQRVEKKERDALEDERVVPPLAEEATISFAALMEQEEHAHRAKAPSIMDVMSALRPRRAKVAPAGDRDEQAAGATSEGTAAPSGPLLARTHIYLRHNEVEKMYLALDSGLPVDLRDGNGRTALHHAAALGLRRMCTVLLDGGAPVDAADASGRTPLHFAEAAGCAAIAHLLRRCGARDDVRDSNGVLPAHAAGSGIQAPHSRLRAHFAGQRQRQRQRWQRALSHPRPREKEGEEEGEESSRSGPAARTGEGSRQAAPGPVHKQPTPPRRSVRATGRSGGAAAPGNSSNSGTTGQQQWLRPATLPRPPAPLRGGRPDGLRPLAWSGGVIMVAAPSQEHGAGGPSGQGHAQVPPSPIRAKQRRHAQAQRPVHHSPARRRLPGLQRGVAAGRQRHEAAATTLERGRVDRSPPHPPGPTRSSEAVMALHRRMRAADDALSLSRDVGASLSSPARRRQPAARREEGTAPARAQPQPDTGRAAFLVASPVRGARHRPRPPSTDQAQAQEPYEAVSGAGLDRVAHPNEVARRMHAARTAAAVQGSEGDWRDVLAAWVWDRAGAPRDCTLPLLAQPVPAAVSSWGGENATLSPPETARSEGEGTPLDASAAVAAARERALAHACSLARESAERCAGAEAAAAAEETARGIALWSSAATSLREASLASAATRRRALEAAARE